MLDDSIYDDKVPTEVKGKLFVYEISSIDANGKEVTIQYKNLVISNGGDRFRQYEEGEDPQVCVLFDSFRFVSLLFIANSHNRPLLQVHDSTP